MNFKGFPVECSQHVRKCCHLAGLSHIKQEALVAIDIWAGSGVGGIQIPAALFDQTLISHEDAYY